MDMSEYLYHPEEVVTMFSEALRKLDENTVNYMIDELKKERDEAVTARKIIAGTAFTIR